MLDILHYNGRLIISGYGWKKVFMNPFPTLSHTPTTNAHEFFCNTGIAWVESGNTFLTTVSYLGRDGCGDPDGIFLNEIQNNNQVAKKLLFQDTALPEPWFRRYMDISISPDGQSVSYVLIAYPENSKQSFRLIVRNFAGDEYYEIDSSQNEITTPIWSSDSKKLFYTIQGKEESQIIGLDLASGKKTMLNTLSNKADVVSSLQSDDWLVISTRTYYKWDGLYLIHSDKGELVRISTYDYSGNLLPYLGLISLP